MLGSSWITPQWAASQEGLSSMKFSLVFVVHNEFPLQWKYVKLSLRASTINFSSPRQIALFHFSLCYGICFFHSILFNSNILLFTVMNEYILCTIYFWLLNCCWPSPAQWLLVLSPTGSTTTFYCLTAHDGTIYLLYCYLYCDMMPESQNSGERRRQLLGNGSVNMFPLQWMHTQQ
jgi:hypothetical protein